MTVTYIGSLTIGGAEPGAAVAASAGIDGINAAFPDIEARIEALASFSPAPIDFGLSLAIANSIVTSVTAAIAGGLPAPTLDIQIAIVSAQLAALEAQALAIQAQLQVVLDFQALLGAAGVHSYVYAGRVDQFAIEFADELFFGLPGGAPDDHANAVILFTSVPGTWSALAELFKVTP